MLERIAWNTFKRTGNINTFLEFKQVKDIEKNIEAYVNETNKNKGSNNS